MDVKKLISWSKKNYSKLPWRENRSVYSTWISEVMLQQTTVYTVKSRLNSFLEKFPTVNNLANATEEELLIAWKGLGYYQRAKNLKKAAEYIRDELDGKFPETIEELQKIPGIGPYTSSALISIGMDQKALAVDANLERVLARFYCIQTFKGPKLKEEIQKQFESSKILNFNVLSWREFNEAVMDLGREICQARRVDCLLCPIQKNCRAKENGNPLSIPLTSLKMKKEKHELDLIRLVSINNGKIAVVKKQKGEWLAGQYELPTYTIRSTDRNLKQYPESDLKILENGPFLKTGITKYKIKNFYQTISSSKIRTLPNADVVKFLHIEDAKKKLSSASLKVLVTLEIS